MTKKVILGEESDARNMGKKGGWISAIKRLFRSNSNPNLNHEAHKKSKPKRFKHGSFLPFCREPSSIEQILGEIDQHNLFIPTAQPQPQPQPQQQSQQQPQLQPQLQQESQQQPQTQPQPQQSQPQTQPPQEHSQPQTQPQTQHESQPQTQQEFQPQQQPQPQHSQPQTHPKPQQSQPQLQPQPQPSSSSSGRPVSPLQRLISYPKIISPKISHRPEITLQQRHLSATKIQAAYRGYMARRSARGLTGLVRLQRVVTSRSVKRQTVNAMKQMQLLIRVQSQIHSRRLQMLENHALKQQSTKNSPRKQSEERWDNSLITKEEKEARLQRKADAAIRREKALAYAYAYTHQLRKDAPTSAHKTSGYPWWWKWLEHELPYHTTPNTPKNHQFATTPSRPTTPMSSRSTNRLIKTRKGASSVYSVKDDDSLRSCPPFSGPNYMSPTASARAKARPTSNPKERCATPTTPGSETSSRRRFSSPFTPNNKSPGSVVSMDSSVGRKPFNRFV